MTEVRQAHMPGNYELYDPSANNLGPVICKMCWESFGKENPESLNTVWVVLEGRKQIWWLCENHTNGAKSEKSGTVTFVKSSRGVLLSPAI